MRTVYICESNCVLHKSGETILIKKGGRKIDYFPLIDVGNIVVFGNTQVSTPALNYFFQCGLDVVFMSESGFTKGRILAEKASNVVLRIAQFERWRESGFPLKISKEFIEGKTTNQCYLMKKYYKYTGDPKIKECIDFINSAKSKISKAEDINTLMGIEGIVAKKYFECFPKIIKHYDFPGRKRRPAYDPVNALLNLGYSFLSNELSLRLKAISLDIELGYLHGIRYGRKSLALDIMEEFRPCFIDEFVIYLLNKRILIAEDFEIKEEGCILKKEALKKFCVYYHERFNEEKEGVSWKKIFDKQISRFRKTILEGAKYLPYESR